MSRRPRARDDLRTLDRYHSPQVDAAVRLNTNESPYPPPPEFVDRWAAALRAIDFHRYPDRHARALREKLGVFVDHPAERVLCANGSNEVLQTILLGYGGPDRTALLFEPTYALHAHIARITATRTLVVPRRGDFTVDPGEATAAIEAHGPAVVLLCSPNNPTGTVEPLSTVERLSESAAAHGALLVVDEAYGEFATRSALELVDESRPLVVVRTYSKVWSLAAIRLGFAIGPSWVVEELEKVVLPYALSVPSQLAGRIALDFREDMQRRVATLVADRTALADALAAIPGLTVFPSGANFVLVRVDGDAHAVWKALLERGVLVRDFSSWPRVEQCLRITVGTPAENAAVVRALREARAREMAR